MEELNNAAKNNAFELIEKQFKEVSAEFVKKHNFEKHVLSEVKRRIESLKHNMGSFELHEDSWMDAEEFYSTVLLYGHSIDLINSTLKDLK